MSICWQIIQNQRSRDGYFKIIIIARLWHTIISNMLAEFTVLFPQYRYILYVFCEDIQGDFLIHVSVYSVHANWIWNVAMTAKSCFVSVLCIAPSEFMRFHQYCNVILVYLSMSKLTNVWDMYTRAHKMS